MSRNNLIAICKQHDAKMWPYRKDWVNNGPYMIDSVSLTRIKNVEVHLISINYFNSIL